MYPKNAASPQRIAIGAVVQISDGAVQTSGVSVKVMPQAGAAGAGGGTVAYEEGIVHYVPTQAETNYASFMLIAYKTGCIPVSATIVTTASGVAGYAGLDWATINAPTTTVGLSGTTVGVLTTYTGNTPQTGDSFARLGAPAGASTAADIAAIQAKTTNLPAAPASTTNITAGTITTVTNLTNLPAITANWLTAAGTAADFGAEIADAVWNAATATYGSAGSYGEALEAVGSAADPWLTNLPGAYGAGTAGKIIGDNLNATVSSRATQTSVDTIDDFLDTEIAAIKAKTDLIPAAPAAVGDIPTANQNADAYLDRANAIETGLTPRQAMRLEAAAAAGKLSGAATTTVTIRNAVADSKNRITATVDADGNRSAITTDVS